MSTFDFSFLERLLHCHFCLALVALALLLQITAANPDLVCDGATGPDFFNMSALISKLSTRTPNSQIFGGAAEVLTEIQESILHFICMSGFRVSDNCGMHRPEHENETQIMRCVDSNADGLGHIYTGFNLAHMLSSSFSCCSAGAWQHLFDLISGFRTRDMGSAVGQHWQDFIAGQLENVLKLDQVMSDVHRINTDVNANTKSGEDLMLMQDCWSCFSAYELLKVMAGSAKMLAWGYMYESANRLGMISLGDWTYESWRGVHHVVIVHNLLKELEAIPELWVTPDGKLSPEFRAVEVGVYQGISSMRLLKWQPNLKMLLVDPYARVMASGDNYKEMLGTDPDDDLRLLRRGMAPYVEAHRASILVAPSVLAASWVQDNSIALVFIDGDHSSSAVVEDVLAWLPKVRPGGIIAGHDYHPLESWGNEAGPSVAEGVQRTLPPGRQLHLAVEGVWWWVVHDGDVHTMRSA